MADAPGYASVLHPSQRNEQFVVGSGKRVANMGQIKLRIQTKDDDGLLMSSVFQVAEITRPLMSLSELRPGHVCIFEKTNARVVDSDGSVVARLDRNGGVYTCTMRLRRSEARNDPVFGQQER